MDELHIYWDFISLGYQAFLSVYVLSFIHQFYTNRVRVFKWWFCQSWMSSIPSWIILHSHFLCISSIICCMTGSFSLNFHLPIPFQIYKDHIKSDCPHIVTKNWSLILKCITGVSKNQLVSIKSNYKKSLRAQDVSVRRLIQSKCWFQCQHLLVRLSGVEESNIEYLSSLLLHIKYINP